MKKLFIVIVGVMLVQTAWGVRAPAYRDGIFSGMIAPVGDTKGVTLKSADINARFSQIVVLNFPNGNIEFTQVYKLENTTKNTKVIRFDFPYMEATNIIATVNQKGPAWEEVRDDEANKGFILNVISNRESWKVKRVYKMYFERLDYFFKEWKVDNWRDKLETMPANDFKSKLIPYFKVFGIQEKELNLRLRRYTARLEPGDNTIVIRYSLPLYINETTTRWGGYTWERGFLGYELLVYTARGWKKAQGMKVACEVEVPDLMAPGAFGTGWHTPIWYGNDKWSNRYIKHKRRSIYRADISIDAESMSVFHIQKK